MEHTQSADAAPSDRLRAESSPPPCMSSRPRPSFYREAPRSTMRFHTFGGLWLDEVNEDPDLRQPWRWSPLVEQTGQRPLFKLFNVSDDDTACERPCSFSVPRLSAVV